MNVFLICWVIELRLWEYSGINCYKVLFNFFLVMFLISKMVFFDIVFLIGNK